MTKNPKDQKMHGNQNDHKQENERDMNKTPKPRPGEINLKEANDRGDRSKKTTTQNRKNEDEDMTGEYDRKSGSNKTSGKYKNAQDLE